MVKTIQIRRERILAQPGWQGPFLEHEHRNVVLPNIVDQMRAGCLTEVGHTPPEEGELGVLDFRQIEGEGDLSLKPRFHRVPIGGDQQVAIHFTSEGHTSVSHFMDFVTLVRLSEMIACSCAILSECSIMRTTRG